MTENDLRAIESALGYGFKNIDLLQLAKNTRARYCRYSPNKVEKSNFHLC